MLFEQTKQNNILTFKTNKYTLKHLNSIERQRRNSNAGYLSTTKQAEKKKNPRFSEKNVNRRRPESIETKKRQRKEKADRLIMEIGEKNLWKRESEK